MTSLILQFICLFLFAVGLLFIVVELRTKFDKSFLYFGISLILLCMITGLDLWVILKYSDPGQSLYYMKVYHILACGYYVFSLWYVMLITDNQNLAVIKIWVFISIIFSLLFFSPFLLILEKNQIRTSIIYKVLFIPFTVISICIVFYLNAWKIRHSEGKQRRILTLHLIGCVILCITGLADLYTTSFIGIWKLPVPSFLVIGALGFGITTTLIFTERFMMIIQEKEKIFSKLEIAFKELEEASALRELGESTAIINHEIKNYMTIISGYAEVMRSSESLTEKGLHYLSNIEKTIKRLIVFSDDILDLSKSRITSNKSVIDLYGLLKKCIKNNFILFQDNFVFSEESKKQLIHANWSKLEHVFINIFKNAIEAKSDETLKVQIRLKSSSSILLTVIEDNGIGCNEEQMKNMFKAFYTTKSVIKSTGLGMSIIYSIIQSHGGKISAYSKNLEAENSHGMRLEIVLPQYVDNKEDQEEKKHSVVLITKNLRALHEIINVMQNVQLRPFIMHDWAELQRSHLKVDAMKIIGDTQSICSVSKHYPNAQKLFMLSSNHQLTYVLSLSSSNKDPEIFSEEFVLSNLF